MSQFVGSHLGQNPPILKRCTLSTYSNNDSPSLGNDSVSRQVRQEKTCCLRIFQSSFATCGVHSSKCIYATWNPISFVTSLTTRVMTTILTAMVNNLVVVRQITGNSLLLFPFPVLRDSHNKHGATAKIFVHKWQFFGKFCSFFCIFFQF